MKIEELEVLKTQNAVKAKQILEAEDGVIEDAKKLLDENSKINEKIEALKSIETQLLPVNNEVIKETKMSDIILPSTAMNLKSLPFNPEYSGHQKGKVAYAFGCVALASRGHQKSINWLNENYKSYKGMTEGTNSAGGFMVPDELIAELIFLREQYGVVRRNASIRTMHSDTLWIPKNSASSTAYWVGEETAITQSLPTFDRVQVLAKKLGILTAVSSELNEDSIIEIGVALAQDFAFKIEQEIDRVCMIGSAANATDGNIDGFITANLAVASNYCTVAAATGSAANYNAVTIANLRSVVAKLALYADAGAKWYFSRAFWNDVVCNRLDALSGNAALDLMNFQNGNPTLFGYPVEFSQHLTSTAAGTNNAPLAALANLKTGTVLGDRRDVNIQMSSDYLFNTDQLAFKCTTRVGFAAHDVGTSTTPSSVVVLKRTT